MDEEGVSRISISVPPSLLKDFDIQVKRIGLDRSKAVQIAMRNFLAEYGSPPSGEGVEAGVLVLVYDHDVKGLQEELTDSQHKYNLIINSSTHIHLDERNCMEVVAVQGRSDQIQNLSEEMLSKRGIKQLKRVILKVE